MKVSYSLSQVVSYSFFFGAVQKAERVWLGLISRDVTMKLEKRISNHAVPFTSVK